MTEGASVLIVALALMPFAAFVIWGAWKSALRLEGTLDVSDDDRGES